MSVAPPNYTQVPNLVLDDLLPEISSLGELKVTLAIARRTIGFHREERCLSLSDLQRLTGMSRQSVSDGVQAAIERGIVGRRKRGNAFVYGLRVQNLGSQESRPEVVQNLDHPLKKERKRQKETPPTPSPIGFDDWLTHHEETTGHRPPGPTTKGRAELIRQFGLCLEEVGGDVEALKIATVGAHADPYRRDNGYDVAESVLRPSKVLKLVNQGRRGDAGRNGVPVERRTTDGVPQMRRAGGAWETDFDAVEAARR